MEALKYLLNGAKFPNWAKLVIVICIILAIYIGQFTTTGQLADSQREVEIRRTRQMQLMVLSLRSDLMDIHMDIQEVAAADSIRNRRLERKVDRLSSRVEDINENGTDSTNERIDELMRAIKRR